MVSAASSGLSQWNSSSKAITSSTVSRLSAPRSSMKLAPSTTFSGSTPRCSTTIFFTRSPMSLIVQTSCFLDLGCDPEQIATIANGLVVVDFGAANSDRGTLTCTPPSATPAGPNFGYHTSKALPSVRHRSRMRPQKPSFSRDHALEHGHPAIDMECLPGNIGGLIGRQIDRRRRHIGGRSQPARGNSRQDRLVLLFIELVGHRGGDKAGRDAIGGDVALGIFGRHRLHHADHAGLGGGVIALPR